MTKVELITLVLERLFWGVFHTEDAGTDEERIVFPLLGFLDDMEVFFAEELMELDDIKEAAGQIVTGHGEPGWDDDDIGLFAQMVWQNRFGRTLGDGERKLVKEVFHGWERDQVLVWFYKLVHGYKLPADEATAADVRSLASARERVSDTSSEEMERRLSRLRGHSLNEKLADELVRRLSLDFSEMVQRMGRMEVISAEVAVDERIQHFIGEAAKCYIHGSYSGCVAMCRVTLEAAFKDLLQRIGVVVERRDGLGNLISLAKEKLPDKFRPTLDMADEITKSANAVVHTKLLSPEKSIDIFAMTRGILRELYSL